MAVLVTFTSLLVSALTITLVSIPTVVGQAQCNNGTIWTWSSYSDYLTSPGYPGHYPSNMSCQWSIRAIDSSSVVLLKLTDFDLEGPQPDCTNDYVEIYDGKGSSTGSSRIQLLCGQVSDTQFTSSGSDMTVVFHSDGSNNFEGFRFSYSSQNKSVLCANTTLVATGTAKYITSTGYPSNYPSNMSCQWYITADLSSHVVMLKLLDFYLEGSSPSCINDYVAIYDGGSSYSPRIQLLCDQVPITQFTSTGPSMTVVFHSDWSDNYKGFKFEYTSLDMSALCTSNILVASGAAKYITSPGYPNNYPSNMDCQWYITADLSSRVVVLKLLDFYLERSSLCKYDYVAIYDGDSSSSPRLRLLCGRVSDKQFTSTGPSMTVVFRSYWMHYDLYRGFKFEYTSLEKSALCTDYTLVATGTAKYITSPGYPDNYPSYTNCHWLITADLPSHIVVLKELDFHLDGPRCTFVNVALYDGDSSDSPRIQFLCGHISNTQFTSTGPSMTIVFLSNVNNNFRGFKFEYTSLEKSALCSDVTLLASAAENYLTSPNYPILYPSNMDCEWHITADSYSSVVVLWYSEFSLDGFQPECTSDYVKIYDGLNTSSPLLQVMCGQMYYGKFVGTKSVMTVVFHSDGGNNYYNTSFRFTYHSQENGHTNAGLGHTGTIVPLATSSVGVPIILLVVAISIRRRITRRQLMNAQSRVIRSREAGGRSNSLFIVSLWTSNARGNPPYVGMEGSQNASDPPPYSSLNCNVDDNLPAYTPRDTVITIESLVPGTRKPDQLLHI